MRGVEIAEIELVPDIGPRHLPHEIEMQALVLCEAEFGRRDQERGVDERDEADADGHRHRNSSAAVTTERAISAIFFFSFIAVRRSKV